MKSNSKEMYLILGAFYTKFTLVFRVQRNEAEEPQNVPVELQYKAKTRGGRSLFNADDTIAPHFLIFSDASTHSVPAHELVGKWLVPDRSEYE